MGEVIKLTQEIVKEQIWMGESDFEFDGEKYVMHNQLESDMDDNGSSHPFIYERKSDGKFFMIVVQMVRYGYEDYGYEEFANDCEMYESEQVEIKRVEWKTV